MTPASKRSRTQVDRGEPIFNLSLLPRVITESNCFFFGPGYDEFRLLWKFLLWWVPIPNKKMNFLSREQCRFQTNEFF